MTTISIDLSKQAGAIKDMNGVNNGPTFPGVRNISTNFESYKAAEISYARTHDSSYYEPYGGEHIVDVHRIFKNFDADVNDPESYLFEPTDIYLKNIADAGTKIFYRLGASIEHHHKYGTRVPKDFQKWAEICEHIIRHYNEGWADGMHLNIEYWEIWNEADCKSPDGSNPCWQGTDEQYLEFYGVVAKHLKSCFPHLKIGGPAFCREDAMKEKFLPYVKENNLPLDFYSYHKYSENIEKVAQSVVNCKNLLAENGITDCEIILNEWNYVLGWQGDRYNYSLRMMKSLKGASFISGVMAAGQATPLDKLMYYEARPCSWCGLFDHNDLSRVHKGYYSFCMFSELRKLGTSLGLDYRYDDIYAVGATDGINKTIMLTYFTENDNSEPAEVKLEFTNSTGNVKVSYYLLDEDRDAELVREEFFTADKFNVYLKQSLFSTYMIKIENM